MLRYNQFEVLSFDCYGTLVDWETGILLAVKPVLRVHGVTVPDDTILETYAAIESDIEAGPYQSYRNVLRQAMAKMCERFGFEAGDSEHIVIANSLTGWPPFEDTISALKALKNRYRLAIISNVDDELFEGTNRRLGVDFDHIVTAAQAGAYKPSLHVFDFALKRIGCPAERLLHVAQSLYHDHAPAKKLGLSTVWIDRRHDRPGSGATPEAVATPDATFSDLASLVREMGV
ncbi:MAG: haloacid dehalogenase type II [Candidatus Zixiibacteriota bacterium]